MSAPRNIAELQNEINALDPRYQLEKIIGSGSYGIVVRAKDTRDNNQLVAIKRINKEIFEELILAKRILREIKLLAHFKDENIVGLRNILTPKSDNFEAFFIVMDIMETDLKQVLKSGQRLTDSHIQFFIYQALRGLKVIHAAGVIHRDITPANILVNTNCDLKLCDFGLAKEESDEGEDMTDYVTMRWYRAPELVMEHKSYTPQIDVWGIGCILGELLGSRPLCQGKDRVNQLDKIVEICGSPTEEELTHIGSAAAQKYLRKKGHRERPVFRERYPNASDQALDLLDKMLQFNPAKRIGINDALRHPYLAQLFDDADLAVKPGPWTFDEKAHPTVHAVKHAIVQEAVKFHQMNPSSAPQPPKATPAVSVTADSDGRTGQTSLEKPQKDEGEFKDH